MKNMCSILFCVLSMCLLAAVSAEPAMAAAVVVDESKNVLPVWLQIATLVVTAAAGIATVTPTPKDDGVLKRLKMVLDLFAFNFGRAKNKDTEK